MLKLATLSGKGGVGKTTIAVNLAAAFNALGKKTGLIDMDLTGPNVARALGLDVAPLDLDIARAKYLPIDAGGIKVLSMASILPRGKALIWEGSRRQSVIKEFITAADWTDTEVLLADLPPGVGDETIAMVQMFVPDSAVVVTIPHSFALEDYLRCRDMLAFWHIPVAKTVMNMAYYNFKCPHRGCKQKVHRVDVFHDTEEAAKLDGNIYQVPFDPGVSASNKVDLTPLAKELLSRMVVA